MSEIIPLETDVIVTDARRGAPPDLSVGPKVDTANLIRRGQAALDRLEQDAHRNFGDWVDITRALAELQTAAMNEAGSNSPQGSTYRKIIARKLGAYGFDRLHKSTRCFLLRKFAPDLDRVAAWRAEQTSDLQLELNHPRVVLTRWKTWERQQRESPDGNDNSSDSATAVDLATAWAAATPDQRRDHLDRVGRKGLCAEMSLELLAELEEHVLGQHIETADASSSIAVTLTRILQYALSATSESERANAIARIRAKLKANNRTLHDVVIAIAGAASKKRKAGSKAAKRAA